MKKDKKETFQPQQQKGRGNGKNKQPQKPKFNLNWIYIFVMAALLGVYFFGGDKDTDNGTSKPASYTEFQKLVKEGYVKDIKINNVEREMNLYIKPDHIREIFKQPAQKTGKSPYLVVQYGSVEKVELFIDEQKRDSTFVGTVTYDNKQHSGWWDVLISFGPILLLLFFWMLMFRGAGGGITNGIFGVGKSNAKVYEGDESPKVTFKDVAGQEGAKQEVQEIVEFLKNPERYTNLGGKIPKGALLVGPPGTGKTLLAKAVAGEAGVPFFSMSGSDFVEMFVGVGASRVRDLFEKAKAKAPCIIFIDEIDAVGRSRSQNPHMGGNDERENTLNALLTEMDGFGTNSGVIVLAATNRADMLDKALLRAGRFDRQINVDLPDLNERKAIFEVHLKPLKLAKDVDSIYLARQTPGFSGADIANVCNEAALIGARNNHKKVTPQDFLDAVDRIIGGLEKKTKVMTSAEKRTIALHEAGHATISWFLEHANPLVKVSIVPRGRALGAAWYMPEERQITTKEAMLDEMCSLLGGRAAEELFVGQISSGAMNDLERSTKQAYSMIAYMGMGEKIPNLCYYNNYEYQFQRPYSEATARLIDEEVLNLVAEQYARAKAVLTEHKDGHNRLADVLMEREVIMAEDVEAIFGPRPFISRSQEILKEEEKAREEEELRKKELAEKMAAERFPDIKPNAKSDSESEGEKA